MGPMNALNRPVRLAIIDNSVMPDIYQPVRHWAQHLPPGCEWKAFAARSHAFPRVAEFSHVILTGSEASILDPEPWALEEAEWVRGAVDAGLALLGSCWGHQLLAYTLGGPASVGRCARPEIGWLPIRVAPGGDILGARHDAAYSFTLHFDEVLDAGKGAFTLLASSPSCPVQAVRWTQGRIWGIQAHPEVDIPTGTAFLRALAGAGFKGRNELLAALDSAPKDSGLIRTIVPAFLGS